MIWWVPFWKKKFKNIRLRNNYCFCTKIIQNYCCKKFLCVFPAFGVESAVWILVGWKWKKKSKNAVGLTKKIMFFGFVAAKNMVVRCWSLAMCCDRKWWFWNDSTRFDLSLLIQNVPVQSLTLAGLGFKCFVSLYFYLTYGLFLIISSTHYKKIL